MVSPAKTREALRRYSADPMAFLSDLVIPGARGAVRFGNAMADFQRERFAALAPALLAVSRGETPPIGRHFWEATKSASKDSDLAAALLWLLAFGRRPLDCQIGAADQGQADELRKAARDILHLNAWLMARVEVQSTRIVCKETGASAEIIPSDVTGSHGSRPDVLIVNELSHIAKQEFAENLLDNASKMPNGIAVIATNAGFLDTWQWRWREMARESSRWFFHRWDKPAPWLDAGEMVEARRRNSSSRYLRLWEGVWASGNGDALSPEDIEASLTLDGPMENADPRFGWVAGLDLGVKHDHSAFVVLGAEAAADKIHLADCRSWSPDAETGEVQLEDVKAEVLRASRRFPSLTVGYDPHQCSFMAQQLRQEGVHMVECPFVGKHLDLMASSLLQAFTSRSIALYPDPALLRDLRRLSIVEKSYGYKLEGRRSEDGHIDRAIALSIAIPLAGDALRGGGKPLVIETFSIGERSPRLRSFGRYGGGPLYGEVG